MATDADSFTFFGSHLHSSNPLSEIYLLVPFPTPSSQGFSDWTVPATSLGPTTLAGPSILDLSSYNSFQNLNMAVQFYTMGLTLIDIDNKISIQN